MNNKKLKEDPRADAIYEFAGRLTSMKEPMTISSKHNAAPMADLVDAFLKEKGWGTTFGWKSNGVGKMKFWFRSLCRAFTYRWTRAFD